MRIAIIVVGLQFVLGACVAPGPEALDHGASGGLAAADGVGERCLFGEHLDDLIYGGRFDFRDDEVLTADMELGGEEDKQLRTAVWDDGVRDLADLFAEAEGGRVRKETVESRVSDHPPFVAYTWTVDDAPRGAIFPAGSLDVVAQIRDGWMEACTAASAPPPGPCRFGETLTELLYATDFEVSEPVALTAADDLTLTQQKHVLTGFRRDRVRGLDDAFSRTDDGIVKQWTLTDPDAEAGAEPFSLYTHERGGEMQGFLFEGEALDVLARVDGEDVRSCRRFVTE